jgi:hypothetical protein
MLTEHPPEIATPVSDRTSWVSRILVPEMWGAVAIATLWLAVSLRWGIRTSMILNSSSGYTDVPRRGGGTLCPTRHKPCCKAGVPAETGVATSDPPWRG